MDCNEATDTRQVHVLPDACVELFISYTEVPVAIIDQQLHQKSMVSSRMSTPTAVQMRKGSGCIAVCFKAGLAYPFFKHSMDILSNASLALDEVWGYPIAELEEQLAKLNDNFARVAIVQQYLLQQLHHCRQDLALTRCLELIAQSPTEISLAKLYQITGYGQRHLARKFNQYIGLSPKEYLKVNRFIASLKQLINYPQIPLTQIAYKSGYFDQAHFIRDYQTYAGYTPREIVRSQHILY